MLLVRHPGTAATRAARVPDDEPALDALPDLSGWLGRSGVLLRSPAQRCAVPGATVHPALGPWDLGSWTGRPLADLAELAAWRTDPDFAAHGGESLRALRQRVGGLLESWRSRTGRWAAVTHGAVIRAAVLHALGAPALAAWDLDVAPASSTELHVTAAGWRVVRVNCRAD